MGHKTNKLVEKSSAPIQSQLCSAAKEDKQSLHVDTMSTSIIDNKVIISNHTKCSRHLLLLKATNHHYITTNHN